MHDTVQAFFDTYDFGEGEELGLAFQHLEEPGGQVLFMIEQADDLDAAEPHAARAMQALKGAHPECAHLTHRVEADH